MKKILIWASVLAFLGSGCAGTAKIRNDMEMRTAELKYEYESRTVGQKKGTLEIRSYIVDDVLPPDTDVKRTFSIIVPLIVWDAWYHEYRCSLVYNQIKNNYKQFMRESFEEEVNRSSLYSLVEKQGSLTIDITLNKIDMSASLQGGGAFCFFFIPTGSGLGCAGTESGYSANAVNVDVQTEVVLKKNETIVFSGELHGRHTTDIISVITPPEYTTVMIDALAKAVQNMNSKIVKLINQQEIP